MKNFNIIIPSITVDKTLLRCLDGISKQTYKNFYVTILLDNNKNLKKLSAYKFKIKSIITNFQTNMSKKRNLGAKKTKSHYLAFIDSDAVPFKNWLLNAFKILKKRPKLVVGGPNAPYNIKSLFFRLTHYCKRSFFVTGSYSFLKYVSFNRYCDFLDSSNFIINRKIFLKIKMNESIYIGEDHDFFYRLKKKYKKLKIFFSKNVAVFHEDKRIDKYFWQRFCYGMNVFSHKSTLEKKLFMITPFLIIFIAIIFFIFFQFDYIKFIYFFIFTIITIIFINIKTYISIYKPFDMILTVCAIILANIFYGLGTLVYFLGLRKIFEKKIYRKIQNYK